MKTGFAFVVGLLLFSGGGMRGRIGSVIAAVIVPSALTQTGGTQPPPPPSGTIQKPGPGNTCPSGYEYITRTGKCMQKLIIPAGSNHTCPSNYYYDSSSNQCLLLGNPQPL